MRHACFALFLGIAATAGWADDIVVDKADVYYDVTGTTATEVLDDLRRQAKTVGKDHFAEARWHIQWKYHYDHPTSRTCRIKDLRLYLIQRTTLPRWSGAGAAPEIVARWRRFMEALRVHEKGHQEHGVRAAREIRKALGALRASDCARIEAQADQAGASIIARYAGLDVTYDAETRHGFEQGAYWSGDATPARGSARPR